MSTVEPSRVGTVIAAKYRLDEELGRGGMGAVYRAFHLRVHKVFALKMLLGDIARHKSIASRFLLEAQAAGRIGHPGILDVYDVGEDTDGAPFIVMELLRGEPLSNLVRRERLEPEAACWIAMEVLEILEAAHKAGIIHRDVKPQNVFITEKQAAESGSAVARGVKLLDFGIAKFSSGGIDGSALTRSGEIIGSPLYMAPEQAKGEPDLDERADLWSVGAMLFEMLTGQCAHAATTPVAVLAKILTEQAPAPSSKGASVPAELDALVARALRIDRAERWPSARTMRDALAEIRAQLGAPSLPKIPAAVKISVPPASNDRTPGAITSTVAAPSDAPRPWSHAPTPLPAAGAAASPAAVAAAAGTTVPSVAKSRTRSIAGGIGALIVLFVFGPRIVARFTAPETSSSPKGSASAAASVERGAPGVPVGALPNATEPSPSAASAALPPSGGGATSANGVASAGATGAPGGSDASSPAPGGGVAASSPGGSGAPSLVPVAIAASAADAGRSTTGTPTGPRCQPGEVVSNGHCCAKGLEWSNGRCERPLATTF